MNTAAKRCASALSHLGTHQPIARAVGALRTFRARFSKGLVIAAASAVSLAAQAAHAEETAPEVDRLRIEARAALARGEYQRAHSDWERVLQIAPEDREALREGGRSAHAVGKLQRAEWLLGKSFQFFSGPDPEAHFLRGEILHALGRAAEGDAELTAALEQIGDGARDRRERLWLARIHAHRGEADAASALYAELAREDPTPEVPLLWAEGLLLCERDRDAQRVLEDLLARDPSNPRGRELLALVFERRREIGKELAMRKSLARDAPGAATVRDLGRALERSGDPFAARSAYQRAQALAPVEERPLLEDAAERMRLRTAPELAVSTVTLSDPLAEGGIVSAGVAAWLDSRLHLAVRGWRSVARSGSVDAGTTGASLLAVASQPGLEIALSGQISAAFVEGGERTDLPLLGGGSAQVRVRAAPWLQLEARAHARVPWDESAATISLGASTTGAAATAYALPFGPALVLSAGASIRELEIPQASASTAPAAASQMFGIAGVDWVAWADYAASLRGEALDDPLAFAAPFGSAVVLSFRQYGVRASQSAAFAQWLNLVERASVSELGATLRRTALAGRAGLELTGGLGYDPLRGALLARAGASVAFAPWRSVRLTLRYELGTESQTGLVGQRHLGGLSAHVDF